MSLKNQVRLFIASLDSIQNEIKNSKDNYSAISFSKMFYNKLGCNRVMLEQLISRLFTSTNVNTQSQRSKVNLVNMEFVLNKMSDFISTSKEHMSITSLNDKFYLDLGLPKNLSYLVISYLINSSEHYQVDFGRGIRYVENKIKPVIPVIKKVAQNKEKVLPNTSVKNKISSIQNEISEIKQLLRLQSELDELKAKLTV